VNALTGLALARQGRHRSGIPHLRRAFPALGGPYQASVPTEARRLYYPLAFEAEIRPAAELAGVPPNLVYGIIREESAFDVTAMSRVGARGLMQVMPATGREVAGKLGLAYSEARLDDPAYNVRLGSTYFGQVLRMFDGRTELALAGYNGGPYRMKRLWREAGPRAELDFFLESLPIEESKNYVKRVLVFSDSYEQLYGM
jgi:soluble lytic murein transglycosylase